MNHPPSRTNLPRNCSFDPGDWRILARSWFPVAIAAQAAAGPIGAVLLDQSLVVYRIGMSFIVADDLCPHRGVPLSMGFQDGDGIRCAYHGLRFGAEGKCDHVPASPDMRIPDRLHLKTYPAVEKYGLIWTRLRGAALDVAHFGFVHTETFGDRANTRVPSYVPETNDVGFAVDYWSSVANYPVGSKAKSPDGFEWLRHFEVHLPFTASITVHFPDNGRLVVMNCASPVSSRMTRLFAPIARNFDKHIPVDAVHEFNRQVFEEDRRVVEAQKPEFLPLDPEMEAHIPADRSSFAYRKGLRAMGFSPFFAA